ncbi:hypothetical protein EHI47_24095 [Rhizobium leguminosarum]|uniref:Uncharacterized protein n=2 Tax=Rhizobium TaxID=379 RepID=A0A444HSN2_RHILE|nr:hypothetical protein [Rhizobium leguminosarum bv. viciae]RWX15705.1 hypothetical protein EHI45_09755 [Rhizobium leguminosarum]TBE72662.1 hypothetical protein ELH03_18755 [Rhizobium beringeri]RWX26157.1 hypothetical protein EHI47_24095 [Rhizobium leguminosarum]TBC74777.1 hypothetical protein ELH27_18735 [Rhizobium leguminosarum]
MRSTRRSSRWRIENWSQRPPHPPAGTFSPRGEETRSDASFPFSPSGRRWPEGSDEGAGCSER